MKMEIRTKLKIIFSGLVLLLGLETANAQKPTSKATLWEISGNGIEKPSYIFGTIHMMCQQDYEMSDKVKKIVSESDKIVLEVDLDEPSINAKMQKLSLNEGMKNLKSDIPSEKLEMVDKYFKSNYGNGLDRLGVLKPFVLNSMVSIKAMDCQIVQYEQEFIKLAKQQEKEVIGLETAEFQFSLFDSLDYQSQVNTLVEMIENPDEVEKRLNELKKAYQTQDIQQVEVLMDRFESVEGFNAMLLDVRNKKWVDRMKKQLDDETLFYAVGSGHLPGENGVIALLRSEGFTVSPLN
jgi:uncharacterized protein YbaP (TraB family)